MKKIMKKKITGCVLAVAMATSVMPVETFLGFGETVYAAETESGVENDFKYQILEDGTAQITKYTGEDSEVVVPDTIGGKTVTSIEEGAFRGCSSLKEISLPEGLTEIGNSAFEYCSSLEAINLPEGVTSIGERVFYGCSNLEAINLPEGLTEIGSSAFYVCSSLKAINLPESLTSIDDWAFMDCSSLEAINLPEGLTSIGGAAFYDCSSLKAINLPENLTEIGYFAFSGCSSLEEINLPDSLTSIGNSVFSDCTNLKKIEMKSDNNPNYQTIDGVLYNREGTELIAYPNMKGSSYIVSEGVTSIEEGAFWGCSSLETINLPERLKYIGSSAFWGCSSLETINLPEGVTGIERSAFYDCSSLKGINLPEGLTYIGYYAFYGCSSLEEINLPEGLREIGYSAFENCSSLEEINLPEGLTEIEYSTFSGCSSLAGINLPEGLTSIGWRAFYGCSSLEEINLPDSLTSIGNSVFSDCTNLKKIEMKSDNNPNYQTIDGVLYNREGTELIAYPNMKGSSYIVSEGVTSIEEGAFWGCSSLKEISMPEGLTEIGYYAFSGCSSLETINLPEGLTEIGYSVFSGCSSLEEINLPESLTSIGLSAFSSCTNLKKIEMESDNNPNYQTIDGILYNRKGTELIAYPNMKGSSYTVPEGVTSIGWYAFSGCNNLEAIVLPEGSTYIGYYAFSNCSNLDKVELPKSVSYMDYFAFENSPNVVIYGFSGSYAENYAKAYDIPFVAKMELTSDTGVNVVYTEDAFSGAVTLQATLLTTGDANYDKINIANLLVDKTVDASTVKYQPYEITLSDETGQPVQPTSAVTVKIPCPEGYDGSKCKVYYVSDDGTLTDMQAVYSDDYLSFKTTHFSIYMVTEENLITVDTPTEEPDKKPGEIPADGTILYGDVNGDGEISLMDSALIRRYLAGWSVTIDENAADVNGDGEISLMDSALIRRYLAGWNVTLGEK